MNKESIIVTLNSIKDIDKISKDTKYINLCIDNVDMELINYLIDNGKDYLYSDCINDINGFVYVDYDMFMNSEMVINNIINSINSDYSVIEKIRFVYIYLGKILCRDINVNMDKNEIVSFSNISTINNIWGCIYKRRCTDISISKLFMYILSRIGIKSELVNSGVNSIGNKIFIDDDNFIIVNLFDDLSYIQGGFITKYFDKYNNDKNIDRKINYIRDEYCDYYIDKALSNIDYLDDDVVRGILSITEKIIDIRNIGSYELSMIYSNLFKSYLPNYDVRINNFYVNGDSGREHFIVINYGDNYYSFNYSKNSFISVSYDELYKNIKNNLIGLYDDEDFVINKKEVLV